MDFGLFSNGERTNKVAADTYDEDLFEVTLADRLGFKEAWISEHLGTTTTGRRDTLSVADMFIVKAAALTKQIRFGPGVRPIGMFHPVQVAIEAAMADHLTRGRYMFGFGFGGPATDGMLQRGLGSNDPKLRRERMLEALDLIIRCWTATEPFDYEAPSGRARESTRCPGPIRSPTCRSAWRTARQTGLRSWRRDTASCRCSASTTRLTTCVSCTTCTSARPGTPAAS